jgi:hypothetical protein
MRVITYSAEFALKLEVLTADDELTQGHPHDITV